MSIITTIIGNITVSWSQSLFPPPLSLTRFSPVLSVVLQEILYQSSFVFPTPLPYQVFTRLVCCFTRYTLSTFFCSDQIIAKNNGFFKVKQFFSFNLLLTGFGFSAFCVCFLVGAFSQFCHHETRNSFIFALMHSFLFDLSSDHLA